MKRNFVLFTAFALTAFGSSASACCLFPFFPTYSAGYPSFGVARPIVPAANYYSASFAPSNGFYGAPGFTGGNSGCCGNEYSANFAAFPAANTCGQCNSGCGQCNTGCGQCNTGCGQCQSGYGQYSSGFGAINGCASGNCAGSNCIGTEIRSRPEPDTEFDRQDRDSRTFGNDRDRDLDRDRRDDLDYDRAAPADPGAANSMDDDSFGRPDMRSDPLGSREDWNPSDSNRREDDFMESDPLRRDDRMRIDPMGDDPLGNDDLNGRRSAPEFNGFESPSDFLGRKPPLEDEAIAPSVDPINRSSRKPPMSAPVEIDSLEGLIPSDSLRDPSDVLPKASASDAKTTSFSEGRSFVRLAGFSAGQQKATTNRISSRRSKQQALRWISLPTPVGRVRL